jgi:hypothetical protein
MNHIDEDRLLKYALEIIDNSDQLTEIESHLKECAACSRRLKAIQEEIAVMSGVQIRAGTLPIPEVKQKHRFAYTLFKAAAILIFGFVLGYGTSSWTQREETKVLPSCLQPSPPADSLIGYAATDATLIDREYSKTVSTE